MRVFTVSLVIFLLFSTDFEFYALADKSPRTKKASKAALDRIKRLLTAKAERENAQNDAVVLEDDVPLRNPDAKPHHNELLVNDPEQYFQGDVELSEQQADGIQEELVEVLNDPLVQIDEPVRKKRKVGKEPLYKRWDRTRPIGYDFADNIPESTRAKIREALQLWEQNTCIRFLENGPDVDRLEFFDGGGCSSFVGLTGGTQGISIATPGCDHVGIISHEIGHSLGIFHEQARPDQQNHIMVHYNNIPISRWNNFHPVSSNQAETFDLPYDAGSVMHYGAFGFASNPYRPAISTLDPHLQSTIGQRVGPAFLDFESINIAYGCLNHCPQIRCEHGGYPFPNDCSRCACPPGFSGSHCEQVEPSNCGAEFLVSKLPIFITSPDFPSFFPSSSKCVWLLKAPEGGKVFVQFQQIFHYQCEDTCDKSYVELKTGKDFRVTGYRFCCSVLPLDLFESDQNEMVLIHNGFGEQGRGFKAKIWSTHDHPSTPFITTTDSSPTTIEPPDMPSETTTDKIVFPPWLTRPHPRRVSTTPATVPPTIETTLETTPDTTTPFTTQTMSMTDSMPSTVIVGFTFLPTPAPPIVPFVPID
uniref:Zinc metalloproteinase n=1 Tax=Acrobeloides nanus TaxID=290746 RepID=A0A914CPA3_9BILA